MSNGNKQRGNKGGHGGGGGGGQGGQGGGGNQRRRRGRSGQGGGGGGARDNQPRGPVMTALGESTYEAVFDHGNEGYGVWFDGVVREDPMYRQHWKGGRPIFVKIEEDRILITRELDGPGADFDEYAERIEASKADDESDSDDTNDENSGDADGDNEGDASDGDDEGSSAPGDADAVYSAEEAARLFAAGEAGGSDNGSADDEPEKPKRTRTPRAPRARRTKASDDAPSDDS